MEDVLVEARRVALHGSGKERQMVWNTSLKTAIDTPGFLQQHGVEVVALLMDILPACQLRIEQLAINRLLAAALAQEAFLKPLAAALVKAAAGRPPPQTAYVLLEWSAAVLAVLDPSSAQKAALKLMEAQGQLLEALVGSRHWRPAVQVLRKLLVAAPALLPLYLSTAAALAGSRSGLVHGVLAACVGRPEAMSAAVAALLPVLCDQVLLGRERPSAATTAAYGPLMASLSSEQFSSTVAAAAVKALRRTPEPAMAALAGLLPSLTPDASGPALELITLMVQQLRSKEAVRSSGPGAVAALAARVGDPGVQQALVGHVVDVLSGKVEGKLKSTGERSAVAAALAALASFPQPSGAASSSSLVELAGSVAATTCKLVTEEPTEEVKVSLLAALSAWLPLAAPSPPAPVLAALAAGCGDAKEGVRRAWLRTAAAALSAGPGLAGSCGGCVPALLKVLQEALVKPVLRGDGVVALLVAAQLAAADTAAAEQLSKGSSWGAATAADSPLLSAATLCKLSPQDAAAAAQAAALLLTSHFNSLKQGAQVATVCGALAALLLHCAPEVRTPAVKAARLVAGSSSAALATELLVALRGWMNQPAVLSILAEPGEAVSPAVGTYAHRFQRALLALLPPPSLQLDAVALTALLLASHHPAIARGLRRPSATWQAVVRELPHMSTTLTAHAPSVVEALLGSAGLGCSVAGDCAAASLSLGSAMCSAPGPVFRELLPGLTLLLDRRAHDGLSSQDIRVYETPEGLLSSEVVPKGVYVGEVVQNKNVRKARGRMRTDNRAFATLDDEDDEDDSPGPGPSSTQLAAASRASGGGRGAAGGRGAGRGGAGGGRGAGRGGKEAVSREQAFREQRLAEEAQTRASVAAIKHSLEVALGALRHAVEGHPGATALHLAELSPLVLPLLTSPIVGDAAFTAVRALARCMPPPLNSTSLLLAGCLRLVVLAGQPGSPVSYDHIPSQSAVAGVMAALVASTVSVRRPMPGPSYALVFPVLAAVLHCPHHTPLHDEALAVLALHVRPEQDIPRAASLELLYHLLGIIPAARDRVQPLLRTLCTGVMDTDLPAAASGLLAGGAHVRAAALGALPAVPTLAEGLSPSDDIVVTLAVALQDVSEANAAAAQQLWDMAGCTIPHDYMAHLATHLASLHTEVRQAASAALAAAAAHNPDTVSGALEAVIQLYHQPSQQQQEEAEANGTAEAGAQNGTGRSSFEAALPLLPGELAEEGDEAEAAAAAAQLEAAHCSRCGCAVALQALAPLLGAVQVAAALDFLIGEGLADEDDRVRELMVAAGAAVVDAHGAALSATMLPLFEGYLEPGGRQGRDERRYDLVREGVVVLLGTLAGHMDQGDDKRRAIVEVLLEVLTTPSEAVQRAVSSCLPPLMSSLAGDAAYIQGLLARLMAGLTGGASYGDRRGAAFGLSGVVKGLGISSLKTYGVLDSLKSAAEDKREARIREGALLAYECLCEKLGRMFEPYIIHILPLLLGCFGDGSPQVRTAASDAARLIMGQLSASGVKLVLPALLKGLEDPGWRTKQGSIQLLGSMAHCAPRQLSTCLPRVVPALSAVLSDPHPKVQAAAREALGEVGSVIRSPEMAALVPSLLAAIADPNAATRSCLDVLLGTTFINTIDAASLALLVPVVHRGLRDRGGDTKKRAGRIVGNMCTLTNDPKDMAPYVPLLMPELQKALVDPLPEVRATAARAMGSLVKGMGNEGGLAELLPWLLATLRSEGSSVERSGAAQGLAEVLSVQGEAYLAELLPQLLANARHKNAFVREGALLLFRYLPLMMEEPFQAHLGEVLPTILDGLSDEVEGVRDAALEAGRVLVDAYAASCLGLLLPAVEVGLGAANWRIRQSSVELLGELLFKVAGTSGKVKLDGGSDDEGAACETYGAAIAEALGAARRAQVLARLYLVRNDVQYGVRNCALHVWKTLVVNTPKTLQEILPALMAEVIAALADAGEDRRTSAARCLGELVRKMGERVLGRIIPILQQHMADPAPSTRQGVCAGLREVLENVTRHQLMEHLAQVLPPVQAALVDADPGVREAAGGAFGVLFKGGAGSAVDAVVPSLLAGLDSREHHGPSVEGLRVILGVRPAMFNAMLPKLLAPPITSTSLTAIGELAPAAASVLPNHLATILAAALPLASQPEEREERAPAAAAAAQAVARAAGEEGLPLLVGEVVKACEDTSRAAGAASLVEGLARSGRLPLVEYADELLKALVPLLAEESPGLVLAAWKALEALVGGLPKEELPGHVGALSEGLAAAKERERRKRKPGPLRLAGLVDPPKALGPLLPIYLQGVLQGSSAEVREAAAEGLGELVALTSEEGLKPFTVAITGPLIRIIGDRFPGSIKAAILVTLGRLIGKAGLGLKPFVPQLQTTFLKCLNDQTPAVRSTAAANLGALTKLSARLEQLVTDLATSASTAPDPDTALAYLAAVRGGLAASGDRLTPATLEKVTAVLEDMRRAAIAPNAAEEMRPAVATALAATAPWVGADLLRRLVELAAGGLKAGKQEEREFGAMLLAALAVSAGSQLEAAGLLQGVLDTATRYSREADMTVKLAGGKAVARLFAGVGTPAAVTAFGSVMTALLGPDQSGEVARQALVACHKALGTTAEAAAAAGGEGGVHPVVPQLLPCICTILQRDPSSQVKAAAEQLLKRALGLGSSGGEGALEGARAAAAAAGGTAKVFLTDAYLRRLLKLVEDDWVEVEAY